jgi:hypothetical protein
MLQLLSVVSLARVTLATIRLRKQFLMSEVNHAPGWQELGR